MEKQQDVPVMQAALADMPVDQLIDIIDRQRQQAVNTAEIYQQEHNELISLTKKINEQNEHFDKFVRTLDEYHVRRTNAIFQVMEGLRVINEPFKAPVPATKGE